MVRRGTPEGGPGRGRFLMGSGKLKDSLQVCNPPREMQTPQTSDTAEPAPYMTGW
jgi:hypothetical protein